MPVDDPTTWQDVAKWLGGLIVALFTLNIAAIRIWITDRFGKQDEKIEMVTRRLDIQQTKIAEQDTKVATLEVHVENGNEQRKRIEEKIDHLIDMHVSANHK